jgi:pimeloyl-ACP methyl ester carboxylesterase
MMGLRGTESTTCDPAAWQRWHRLQPQATFVEIPRSGHLVPMERPAATAAAVSEFLAGRER